MSLFIEWIDRLERDLKDLSERNGFNGIKIWQTVLANDQFPDDFSELLEQPLFQKMTEEDKSRFETVLNLRYYFEKVSLYEDKEELLTCFCEVLYLVSSYYNHGYVPSEREMASLLRKGKRRSDSEFLENLAAHCLRSENIAQNVTLTLINPDSFEEVQRQLFTGKVVYRADREKCIENKELHYFDSQGNSSSFKFRSLEGLVGRVVKMNRHL
jgi:hypothetical protein